MRCHYHKGVLIPGCDGVVHHNDPRACTCPPPDQPPPHEQWADDVEAVLVDVNCGNAVSPERVSRAIESLRRLRRTKGRR